MSNALIMDKMQADKEIALRLEHGAKKVAAESIKQAELIYSGVERFTWYASCLTDNYQDVCANLQKEDARFALQLAGLVKHPDIITQMVKLYVEYFLQSVSEERIPRIQQMLVKMGANFASATLTNHAFSGALTTAICLSFGMRATVTSKLSKISSLAVFLMGTYGRVQTAASAAGRLKSSDPAYYELLYINNLEMFYFLIESVINRNKGFRPQLESDAAIASAIMRLVD